MKKLKNLLKICLLAISVVFLSIGSNYAATTSKLGDEKLLKLYNGSDGRSTGYYYVTTDSNVRKPVIKVMETNQAGTVQTANDGIYCLNNSKGFGNPNSTDASQVVKYTQVGDLKQKQSIASEYATQLPQNADNYNKLVWVLDNVSMVNDRESVQKLFDKVNEFNPSIGLDYNSFGNATDNEIKDIIETVQQSAIWYYTNTSLTEFHPKSAGVFSRNSVRDANNAQSLDDENQFDWDMVDDPAVALFKYLIEGANAAVANGYTYSNSVTTKPTFEPANSENVRKEIKDNKTLVGPLKINVSGTGYKITAKINNQDTSSDIKILGSDKTTELPGATISAKLTGNVNKDFYLEIPNTVVNSVNFSLKIDYTETAQSFWINKANVNGSQPIVIVENVDSSIEKSLTIEMSKPKFDLALRKFITKINETPVTNREPDDKNQSVLSEFAKGNVTIENAEKTTAAKAHTKDPIAVATGDRIVYTIRVYNEGEIDGVVTEITDYLPEGLEMVPQAQSTINQKYGWTADQTNPKKIVTKGWNSKNLKAFDKTPDNGTYLLDRDEVQIECVVTAQTSLENQILKNVAEITNARNSLNVADVDSVVNSLTSAQIASYNPGTAPKGKGIQDDDDYEPVLLRGKYFDLSLRKFITSIERKVKNSTEVKTIKVEDRIPEVNVKNLVDGLNTAEYFHKKNAVNVEVGDIVTYTIRVYNEGQVDGYVDLITDHLPPELEFIIDDPINGIWKIDATDTTHRTITTDALSNKDTDNIIKAFDPTKTDLDYKDVQIRCRVKSTAVPLREITNIAEITESSNALNLKDWDNLKKATLPSDEDLPKYKGNKDNKDDLSDSNYFYKGQENESTLPCKFEDDDDFEKVVIERFDLALRKFITGVNDTAVTNRVPVVDTSKFGTMVDGKEVTTCTYKHTKDPVRVCQNDIVTYTIRIYNEGYRDGYAAEVKDDIPEGLEFLPDNKINTGYGWKMLDSSGNETKDIKKAVSIVTDYLSKDKAKANTKTLSENATEEEKAYYKSDSNIVRALNPSVMTKGPDYVDVKVAFKVIQPNTSDRIIINSAQISDDTDDKGSPVTDIDSEPNNMTPKKPVEDDEDIEKIYVKYFDLALRKWVTQAIVIEDGVQKEMDTGHKAEDDPESVVKVDVNKKRIDDTVIKFRYSIRITNEGEIAGYAKEISDYIPQGLKFNKADNPLWEEKDGKIVTTQLKDKLLQPGDQAFVVVVLTWVNDENNMGIMINTAEISEDYNDSKTPDKDSTPNNKKPKEDDIDDAPVALAVVTGKAPTYAIVIGASLLVIVGGVILIKKYVL